MPEFQPPSPSRLDCKVFLYIFPNHFQSPIHFSHLYMIRPKEPTNAQRSSTLDYKNLNHHEITLNDGSCQLFSFTLGVICVTSTSSIEHCPTVFYSHALFTWPYANEVQRTTFSDKVHWAWPSQCQSKMNTMKLEACSTTTASSSKRQR